MISCLRRLFQNQATTDESVCRVYEVGRMRRADDEEEQVKWGPGIKLACFWDFRLRTPLPYKLTSSITSKIIQLKGQYPGDSISFQKQKNVFVLTEN